VIALLVNLETNCGSERRARLRKERRLRRSFASRRDRGGLRLLPPLDQAWLRRRTVDLFRLWEPEPAVLLQGPLSSSAWNKADHAEPGGTASPSR
jgi:hypothetical protein